MGDLGDIAAHAERTTAWGKPLPAKLLVGLLYPRDVPTLKSWAKERLSGLWGAIERESEDYPFDCTDYYREISPALLRCFFSFAGLRRPQELPDWKLAAIALETQSADASRGGRRVNIDPGYLDGARVALASTKDHAQRLYLRDGIYAEITLCHRKTGWERFTYTFPDFKSGRYDAFLDRARADWKRDLLALRIDS